MTPELEQAKSALSATFHRMRLIEGRMLKSITTLQEVENVALPKTTEESDAAGLPQGSAAPRLRTMAEVLDAARARQMRGSPI